MGGVHGMCLTGASPRGVAYLYFFPLRVSMSRLRYDPPPPRFLNDFLRDTNLPCNPPRLPTHYYLRGFNSVCSLQRPTHVHFHFS